MQAVIKRIQSRLKKLGIIKSSQQIREVYTTTLGQNENPTEQEISSVMEKLSENNETQITQVTETVDITPLEEKPLEENHQLVNMPKNEPENIPAHSLTVAQSSAISYDNNFSKALDIQKVSDDSGLALTQNQVFEVAQSLPDSFNSVTDFYKTALAFITERFAISAFQDELVIQESLQKIRKIKTDSRQKILNDMAYTFNIIKQENDESVARMQPLMDLVSSDKWFSSKKKES
jgi:hypothetical protein